MTPADYAAALAVAGLPADKARALHAHLDRRNAVSDRPPVTVAVARVAAILLAAEPDRLSVPTALAEAESVAGAPGLGDAVSALETGLLALARAVHRGGGVGLGGNALRTVLAFTRAEAERLLQALDRA